MDPNGHAGQQGPPRPVHQMSNFPGSGDIPVGLPYQPLPPQGYGQGQFNAYAPYQPQGHPGQPQPFQTGSQPKQFNVGPIPPFGQGYAPRPLPQQQGMGLPMPQHHQQQQQQQVMQGASHANYFEQQQRNQHPAAHNLLNLSAGSAYAPASHVQQQQQRHMQQQQQLQQQQHQQQLHQQSPPRRGADEDYVPDDDDHGAAALLAQVQQQAANQAAQQGNPPPRREVSARAGGSRWTAEEDATLIEAIKENPPLSWAQIGEKLGKRSQVCGQRWYNHLSAATPNVKRIEPNGKIPRGMVYKEAGSSDSEPEESASPEPVEKVTRGPLRRWAGEDDETLKTAFAKHGGETEAAWQAIAADVGHNRTWRACRQRWNTHHKPADEEEDEEEEYVEGAELDVAVEGVEIPEGEEDDDDFEVEDDDEVEADADWDEDAKGPAPSKAKKTSRARPRAPGVKGNHTFTPAGQSPVFLPQSALVAKPPIPFTPTSVIRGRRTLAAEELKGKLFSPSGKVKKVHTCPAENCSAAFKRSEHLKRHYRSVHMGSKPFPCQMAGCTKSFSRKDNLQQHMAMVHNQRAVKLDEPGEDGATHRYEPMPVEKEKKRGAAKPKKAGGKKKGEEDGEDESVEGSAQPEESEEGTGGNAVAGPSDQGNGVAEAIPAANVDPALTGADPIPAAPVADDAAAQIAGYYSTDDFLKQLQVMEESAAAAVRAGVGVVDGTGTNGTTDPALSSIVEAAAAAAKEGGDVIVGGQGGEKRSREDEGESAQQKKARTTEDLDIPVA